jgi:predicted Ser/Thr protein kinase
LTTSPDPRIGSELLGYRIEALLGRGGMGVVYRAHHVALDRKVALKLLAADLAGDERFRERFLRESKLAASLDHPSIVPIYDAGEVEGQLYIAMRYVEGTDLKQLLRSEGALEPKRALALVAQLADALDAAHARGLVHRDVKPSNALLDSADHAYLADFGLTKSASDRSALTMTGRMIGTVDYAAPEQIEGKGVDGRADVYSLGCLLYECLSAEVPFPRDSELAVLWAQVHEPPPKASEHKPELPVAIDAVIAKALAKEAERRYASCAELVEAARDALGLRDVVVLRDRRPLLLALGGALVMAGALATGLVLALGGGGNSPKPDLTVRNNTLVRIDPHTSKIAAVIKVGEGPLSVAVGGRTIWVYNWDDRTVSAIDMRTNVVERTMSISGTPPFAIPNVSITADGSGAWVLSRIVGKGVLTHVRLGLLPREFSFPYEPISVAAGEGAVWVTAKNIHGSLVLRISPSTGAVLASVPLGSAAVNTESTYRDVASIAVGEGVVWVLQGGTIFRIDPATNRITGRANLAGRTGAEVRAGYGEVWALTSSLRGNELVRINPRTLKTARAVPAPKGLGAANSLGTGEFALADGAVWWNGADSGTVWRVDPKTGRIVSTTRVTPPIASFADYEPLGIATSAGGVWVTVRVAP